MVGLSESPEDYEEKGLTPERLAGATAKIAADHGMPMETAPPARMQATLPACRAVVAARVHAPEAERPLLRSLRVRNFSGQLLDEPDTIAGAARDAGLSPSDLEAWTAEEQVEAGLRADMAEAREPMPAARVLDARLANWSGGRRYTCRPMRSGGSPTACGSPCPASSPSPPTTWCWPTWCPTARAVTRRPR